MEFPASIYCELCVVAVVPWTLDKLRRTLIIVGCYEVNRANKHTLKQTVVKNTIVLTGRGQVKEAK